LRRGAARAGDWPRPDEEGLSRLRDAGAERALWDPVCDHTLRFVLNDTFARRNNSRRRSELRVPTDWSTSILVAGRRKSGRIYTLSTQGCYLATARPSIRGATAVIELPLPSGELRIAGGVVYTNVPGNLQKKKLPTGMALRFQDATEAQIERIRDTIAAYSDPHCGL
jgi:hypothetical protein